MGPVGFPEMVMIFIIALLVFGPKKLPELGKSLGKGMREFKKATDELKATWDDQLKEVERSVADVKSSVADHVKDITKDLPTEQLKEQFYSSYQPNKPEPPIAEIPAENPTANESTEHIEHVEHKDETKEVHQA